MKKRAAASLILLGAATVAFMDGQGVGRRFWYPYYSALAGGRTHDEMVRSLGPSRRPALREAVAAAGVAYPPPRVVLVGLKEEKVLEVWVPSVPAWKRIRAYPILAASGGQGPKRREGDQQVPEGVYRLTAFNPNSSYHLSLRMDYPNADDRAAARSEGRGRLGGDIFIHGKAVSIGCLAIGDAAIEELYLLVADAGLARTRLLLAPKASPVPEARAPGWVAELYDRLRHELQAVRGNGVSGAPAIVGLDHIPIAVSNLEAAAERYRELGFSLKAGRLHENGIRNQHAKFPDGTELELITAPEARDALTTTYRRYLESGDGPAFLALYAPATERAAERLAAAAVPSLQYIFLGPRNHSPTDRPEHFAHPNGALSLISVWLAGDDLSRERRLLQALGARLDHAEVHVPDPRTTEIARLPEGDVVLLPASSELGAGRRILGATVRVKSLATVERLLGSGPLAPRHRVSAAHSSSVFLEPVVTHGLWLELREVQ